MLPFLQSKINNSWVDPRKSKSDEKLMYEYKLAWAMAKSADEIIAFVDQMKDTVESLLKKQRGETVDKLRESLS